MNGKGDSRRPMQISHEEYEKRWEAIFGKKEEKDDKKKPN
jgi:hypothetical protein